MCKKATQQQKSGPKCCSLSYVRDQIVKVETVFLWFNEKTGKSKTKPKNEGVWQNGKNYCKISTLVSDVFPIKNPLYGSHGLQKYK